MKRDKKESAMRIMEALSGVDEELLERCEQSKCNCDDNSISPVSGNRIYKWMRGYGGLCAACLCLVVLGAAYFTMAQQKNSTDTSLSQMECAADAMTEEEEEKETAGQTMSEAEENREMIVNQGADSEEDAGTENLASQMSGSMGSVDEIAETTATKENAQNDRYAQTEKMMESEISWEAACSTEILGAYVPVHVPEGYEPLKAIQETGEDGSVNLLLIWTNGQHQLSVKLHPKGSGDMQETVDIFTVYAGENWESKIPGPEEDGSIRFVLLYETGVSAEYKGWLTGSEIKNLLEPAEE